MYPGVNCAVLAAGYTAVGRRGTAKVDELADDEQLLQTCELHA